MSESETASTSQQRFEIQKIYLKDVSFESPNTPGIFMEDWEPETSIQLATETTVLDDEVYEVVLSLTVTASQEDKTAFLVELEQAGIFNIAGFEGAQFNQLLGSYCPATLFPFAREAITELVTKGGFPQMLLTPVNFDALYAQAQQEQQTQSGDSTLKH